MSQARCGHGTAPTDPPHVRMELHRAGRTKQPPRRNGLPSLSTRNGKCKVWPRLPVGNSRRGHLAQHVHELVVADLRPSAACHGPASPHQRSCLLHRRRRPPGAGSSRGRPAQCNRRPLTYYGQLFALLNFTMAAAESAIGRARRPWPAPAGANAAFPGTSRGAGAAPR